MYIFVCLVIGYAVGMINPSYIIAKIKGFDIRKKGSGNAGGSNALITMGKAVGVACILFDIAKSYAAVKLACAIFPEGRLAFACAAVGTVYGHIFPPYMGFKGGKGLACLGGSVLAFDPIVFLIMLGAEVIVVFATNYICFVPVTASVAFPVVYGIMTGDLAGALVLCLITAAIFFRHRENFVRIRKGTEMRFSYLWKKDEEQDRVVGNSGRSE